MADSAPFPWSLGQFTSQDQINQIGQEMSRRAQAVGGFSSDEDLLNNFVQSLDSLQIPRAEVPDTVLGSLAKGAAKSFTAIPKIGGALIEAAGGATGLDSVRNFGQGAREYYEGLENRNLNISPEAQAFAQADNTFWTMPQVTQGIGQGLGDLAQMFLTGGMSASVAAGKTAAEVGTKYAAREAAGLAVKDTTKKAVAETLAERSAKTVGTRAAMAYGGFKGGGATVEQLNQTAQTPGDYATSLLAGIPSAIVNGYADTAIMRYLPQWESIPPRERGTLLQGIASAITTFGKGAAVEGGTEGLQSLVDSGIQSAALRLTNRPQEIPSVSAAIKQALFEAGIGGLTGGLVTATGNVGNVRGPNDPAPRTVSHWQENLNADRQVATEAMYQQDLAQAYDKLSTRGLTPEQLASLSDEERAGLFGVQTPEPHGSPSDLESWSSDYGVQIPDVPRTEPAPIQPIQPAPTLESVSSVPDLSTQEASDNAHALIQPLNAEAINLQVERENNPTPERAAQIETRLKEIEAEGNRLLTGMAQQQQAAAQKLDVPEGTTVQIGDTTITRKGKKNIVVRKAKQASPTAQNKQEDLSGIRGTEEGLNGQDVFVTRPDGTRVAVPTDSLITLINPKSDTLFHEKMHSWMRLFLTDQQTDILLGVYKSPENVADAYGKWADKRSKGHPLFQKMRDLAVGLYHLATFQQQRYQADKIFRSVYREEVPDASVRSRATGKNYQTQLNLHASKQIVQPQSALDRLEANVRDMADRFPREWLGQYENVRYFTDQQAERNAGKDPSKMTRTERFLYNWWEGGRWKIGQEARDANPEKSGYYALTRMVHQTAARIMSIRGDKIRDMRGNEVQGVKNMTEILDGLDQSDLKDLGGYLYALSAKDRHALGKGPIGYTVEQANSDIAQVERLRPDLVEKQKQLKDLGDTALHWLVEVGRIGQDEYDLLRRTHANYAPFWVVPEASGRLDIEGVREMHIPIHKASGDSGPVENPILSFQKNLETYAHLAERSQAESVAIEELMSTTQNNPQGVPVLEKLDPTSPDFRRVLQQFSLDSDKLIKALEKAGALELDSIKTEDGVAVDEKTAPAALATIFLASGKMESDPTAKTFIRPEWTNGKLRFEVYQAHDRNIFNVFTDFDKDHSALINATKKLEPFFGPFARIQRALITTSPNFSAGNPLRDAPMHALFAPDTKGLSLTQNAYARVPHLRGLIAYLRKDPIIQQFNESAMTQNTQVRSAMEQSASKVERTLRRADSHIWNTILHPVEALNEVVGWAMKYPELLANFSENVGRVGVYQRIYQQELAKGKTPEQAKYYAFNKTVDAPQNFSRMGIKVQALNKIAAFFGAQVGGWYRLYEFGRTNPQVMAGFAASLATASIALMMSNRDDERWKDIPEDQKDMYWFVLEKGMPVIRIPKPFEAGTFFGSVPERVAEMLVDEQPNEAKKVWDAATAFNVPTPMPTVLAPLFQNAMNRDWKGSPIVSQGMENLAPEAQVSPYTSELAKVIAGSIRGLSPKFIEETLDKARITSPLGVDNLLRAYGGTAGRMITDVTTDPLIRLSQGKTLRKPGPESTAADWPGIGRFISRYPSTAAQPMADFYDLFNESQKAHNTMLNLRKGLDPKKAQTFATENKVSLMAYKRLQSTAETLNKLNRAYKTLQENPGVDRVTKRTQMDAIAARMARIAESANLFYMKVEDRNKRSPAM